MEKFNEIITASVDYLTVGEKEFLNIHNSIIYYGSNVCMNLVQMSKQLNIMKDSERYLEAGFDTFENYVEDALGLKRSQVYNYLKVAKTYSNEFLLNNSNVGITKLLVLSELEEPVVEKVVETINVEDTKVNDLKELVKSLKKELNDKEAEYKTNLSLKDSEIKIKNDTIEELEQDIELIKRGDPVPADINEIPDDPDTKDFVLENRIKELEEEIKNKDAELSKFNDLHKTNIINQNPELIKFKVKFTDLQEIIQDLKMTISMLDDDNKSKCKNALNAVLKGGIYE